jgi:putative aminophosphonate oxidoreductase
MLRQSDHRGCVHGARHRSFWLQEALASESGSEPPLGGAAKADIAIIGGGYVGLWTAIRIKQWDPACDVAVLEQDICGGGASGRNGGLVLSWWAKLPTLVRLFGTEAAVALAKASVAAIDEIRVFCLENNIHAHFRQSGWLWTATTAAQGCAWAAPVRMCEQLGIDAFVPLPAEEVARRAGSAAHLSGVLERNGATVQPALLARGLRRVALSMGVRIYENTQVTAFRPGSRLTIITADGTVTCQKVVVAMNAWAARVPELCRALAVVSSDMIVTECIPGRLSGIGWTGGEGITDSQQMVTYYQTTHDSRIAFGKGGWGIAFAGRIGNGFDRNTKRTLDVKRDFDRAYSMLADSRIDYDWSGPIDRSVTGLPILGHLPGCRDVVYGVGWSGNGVGPSVLGGKILASLALGIHNEWSRSPLVDQKLRLFPPEPVRYVAAHIIREAVKRKERAEARGHSPNPIAVGLSKLAPAGLEDH